LHFRSLKQQVPFVMHWHDDLRVQLYLSNDESKQVFVGGCLDPNEFALLDRVLKYGMTFVDVGANDGLYSLFAARRVGQSGQVGGFEPSRREFGRFMENIRLNGLTNVHARQVALGDTKGTASLSIAEDEHAGQNTLGRFAYAVELTRKEEVSLIPL